MWEKVLENITPPRWLEQKETLHEFAQILASKIISYHIETRSSKYTVSYPFVLVMATDKIWRVGEIIFTPLWLWV